jgi:hypothetical protein
MPTENPSVNGGGAIPPARTIARQWADRAEELARWVIERLVNRDDFWGAHTRVSARGTTYTDADGNEVTLQKIYTAPGKKSRDQRHFMPVIVRQHFMAGVLWPKSWPNGAPDPSDDEQRDAAPQYVIGMLPIGKDDKCKWGNADIDKHSDADDADANLAFALHIYRKAVALGFHPLMWDTNGRGGYRVEVFFSSSVESEVVYELMRWLVNDYARFGFKKPPEWFPKQRDLSTCVMGNWSRTVGMHHTNGSWATVYNGTEFVAGDAAIDHILSLKGDSPDLIPQEVRRLAAEATEREATDRAAGRVERDHARADRAERRAAIGGGDDHVGDDGSVTTGHRYDFLFRVGVAVRRGGGGDGEVLDAIRHANAKRCSPPHDEPELRRVAGNVIRDIPKGNKRITIYLAPFDFITFDAYDSGAGFEPVRPPPEPTDPPEPAGWRAFCRRLEGQAQARREAEDASAWREAMGGEEARRARQEQHEAEIRQRHDAEDAANPPPHNPAEGAWERWRRALAMCPNPRTRAMKSKVPGKPHIVIEIACNRGDCGGCGDRVKLEWTLSGPANVARYEVDGFFRNNPNAAYVVIEFGPLWDRRSRLAGYCRKRYQVVEGHDENGRPFVRVFAVVSDPAQILPPFQARIVPSKEQFLAEHAAAVALADRGKGVVHGGKLWPKFPPGAGRKSLGLYEVGTGLSADWKSHIEVAERRTGCKVVEAHVAEKDRTRFQRKFKILGTAGLSPKRLSHLYDVLNTGMDVNFAEWLEMTEGGVEVEFPASDGFAVEPPGGYRRPAYG